MSHPAAVSRLIDNFAQRRPLRTTSLIITVFGDTVSQHGDTLWLGSLVRCLEPLGVSERLVRTSVFRLVKEGWLVSERVGRRSYYRFTPYGSHEYARAARRIYSLETQPWDGRWQLIIPWDLADENRELFRRSLYWQGYRNIAAGTYARPGSAGPELRDILDEFDADERVISMQAEMPTPGSRRAVRALVHENWQLAVVARHYREFQRRYAPLFRWLAREPDVRPKTAFVARTLLIHDYRRILLKDPPLPEELLPPAWPGAKALRATAAAYARLAEPSAEYISTVLENGEGRLPPAADAFWQRFTPGS